MSHLILPSEILLIFMNDDCPTARITFGTLPARLASPSLPHSKTRADAARYGAFDTNGPAGMICENSRRKAEKMAISRLVLLGTGSAPRP